MDDERQIVREELIMSEVRRKERLYSAITQSPFRFPFFALSTMTILVVVYAVNEGGAGPQEITALVATLLLLLIDVISNVQTQRKLDALVELLGSEKLREIDRDRIGIGDHED